MNFLLFNTGYNILFIYVVQPVSIQGKYTIALPDINWNFGFARSIEDRHSFFQFFANLAFKYVFLQ